MPPVLVISFSFLVMISMCFIRFRRENVHAAFLTRLFGWNFLFRFRARGLFCCCCGGIRAKTRHTLCAVYAFLLGSNLLMMLYEFLLHYGR